MKPLTKEKIQSLQKDPASIRNICIMAHVDHGKTTLADSLVANNGIISPRMAGKLRYMDSRKDEQERGITMKSSSITLFHAFDDSKEFLINLIDSPGHVDFSSEVSTAVRLCDGAIIVVDLVEGVCPQTKLSLRQAWEENIKMVLVLNKMDRLIVEMKMAPLDAYARINQVLEQVNAITGELFASSVLKRTTASSESIPKSPSISVYDWSTGLEDVDDSHLYFSPDQGNVIFASAVDGWGFDVNLMAKFFSKKLEIDENMLKRTIWGDYYLSSKTRTIVKGSQIKAKKPLFVHLILNSIWLVYEEIVTRKAKDKVLKIGESLGIQLSPRDVRHTDCRIQLHAVLSQWLPLANVLLDMVCSKLPSPQDMCDEKVNKLFHVPCSKVEKLPEETKSLKIAFKECRADGPTIVFISKMFPYELNNLPMNKPRRLNLEEIAERRELVRRRREESSAHGITEEKKQAESLATAVHPALEVQRTSDSASRISDVPETGDTFIAFARVFSGTVRKGDKLYVLGPKYDPIKALKKFKDGNEVDASLTLKDLKSSQHVTVATIGEVYLLMGRELESLEEGNAGNIIGIGGLEEHVLKSATLSVSLGCPAFAETVSSVIGDVSIFRVAVEPKHPSEMPLLVKGLRLLNQADTAVQVLLQESGEHVLATAGEVHLQRCLQDLKERYAKIDINVSEPIVPFRETIILPPKVDMVNEAIQELNVSTKKPKEEGTDDDGLITIITPNRRSIVRMKAVPLPLKVTELILKKGDLIKIIQEEHDQQFKEEDASSLSVKMSASEPAVSMESESLNSTSEDIEEEVNDLKSKMHIAFSSAGKFWEDAEKCIWSVGPRHCGPNILLNKIPNASHLNIWGSRDFTAKTPDEINEQLAVYSSSFVNGFQLATLAGPLCEEPMMGVCFVVEDWTILEASEVEATENGATNVPYGPFSGQIMSAVKEGCRKAFQSQPQRLMAAMYSCAIQVNAEMLGKLYAVLGKRHGRILAGDMTQGSATFSVTAVLPVVESYNFAPEVRKQTSGLAVSPQLFFSHWEVVDIDPFWSPSTQEEYLHFGDKADAGNRARIYMDNVRRRKGLPVERKIVEHAEKQRTLSKKK